MQTAQQAEYDSQVREVSCNMHSAVSRVLENNGIYGYSRSPCMRELEQLDTADSCDQGGNAGCALAYAGVPTVEPQQKRCTLNYDCAISASMWASIGMLHVQQ